MDEKHWLPATFRERGVAVGFTSPLLAGARVRTTERRQDVVVPNPGGVRGVYIFALSSLAEFGSPTLHDLYLAKRLGALSSLTPANVREAARAVAAEGAAGRPAAAAAKAAAEADKALGVFFGAALRRDLLSGGAAGPEADGGQRRHHAAHHLAMRSPESVQADINALSYHLVRAGLARSPACLGRCAGLLGGLGVMAGEIRAWTSENGRAADGAEMAEATLSVAAACQPLVARAQALAADPVDLLEQWAARPEDLRRQIDRADWLLDGWEQIFLLWRLAEDEAARAAFLAEAALLVPPIPREAETWFGGAAGPPPGLFTPRCTPVARRPTPGPLASLGMVARNERIRAQAA